MIEIPYLTENIKLPEGDKTPFLEYILQDQEGNVIDLSTHDLSGKVVDRNKVEQQGAITITHSGKGFIVQIDANQLAPGKYVGVVRDETEDITLLKYNIHVEAAI